MSATEGCLLSVYSGSQIQCTKESHKQARLAEYSVAQKFNHVTCMTSPHL